MTGLLPTSPLQRGIWFNEQLADLGPAYTISVTARLPGRVDVGRLARAYAMLAASHPLLTAACVNLDGVPWLAIGEHPPALAVEAGDEGTIRDRVEQVSRTRFDLDSGPLVRAWLFTLGDDGRSVFALAAHHLIVDGQSKEILLRELAGRYQHRELPTGTPSPPGNGPPPESRVAAAAEYWWRNPPRTSDLRRGGGPKAGDAVVRSLSRQARTRLADATVELGATRFELLLTALFGCLAPDREPVSIAIALSTRSSAEADLIGMYVNELPLTLAVPPTGSSAGSFAATLVAVRAKLRELYPHRTVPLAMCAPGMRAFLATAPISVSYRRIAADPIFDGEAAAVDWSTFNGFARNDLHVMIADGDRTRITFQFPTSARARRRAEALADHVLAVLDRSLAAPHTTTVEPYEDRPPWT